MKQLFLLVSAIMLLGANAKAQQAAATGNDTTARKDTLPYMKYPTLPAFNILLMDSATVFNTFNIPEGNPIALMLFDPDCRHCKDLIRRITDGMDSLKRIRFYMVTPAHSMAALRKFYDDFGLAKYDNIKVVGRDYEFFFHDFYHVKFVPDIALYDKNKDLIKLFEANATVKDLYEYTFR